MRVAGKSSAVCASSESRAMVRSTDQSSRRACVSALPPTSAREPETPGAAKGKARVGIRAGLVTRTSLPTVCFCSAPIQSTSASMSR